MDLTINNWEEVDTLACDPGMRGSSCRKKDELQQVVQFLRFRPKVGLPLTLRKGPDPPDFVLASLTKTTGVEVTWAANERWEEAIGHLAKKNPGYASVSRSWLEKTQKRGKKLGEFLKRKQSDIPSWSSREHAAAKAYEVMDAIQRKTKSFCRPYYPRFEQNWLLIADKNTFDLMNIDEFCESALNLIRQEAVQRDALYFVTRLRTEDVLFQLSSSHCQVIGRVPSR